jgi:lambda family phage portal protein
MPTFINRVKAAARYVFGYDAVDNSRYRKQRGIWPLRSEAIELNSYDRIRMITTLLDMKRNNPVAKAISRLRKTDVVGGSLIPQPQTEDEDYDWRVREMWEDWSEYPESTGTMNMCLLQQEICDAPLFFGDIGVLLLRSGKLQLIEGDRIGQPFDKSVGMETESNQNGVIVTKYGRPIAYTVGDRVDGTLQNVRRISKKDFLLYYKRMRPQQYRGVPELAASVNSLQDVSEYEATEMISAKVSASLSAVIKRQESVQFELQDRLDDADQDTVGRLQRFEPGTFHYLEPGEDISTISAGGRPNVDGIEFVMYHLRKVGASIGIPVEMIMSTIGESSFSASQGLLLQYQSAVEDEQKHMQYIMSKIYKWKLGKWIADGELKVPASVQDPFKVRWQMPAFRWVNKAAQVAADIKYVQLGAQSLDDVASQFGYTAESVMRRKAQNIRQAGIIAEEYGLDSWRELFSTMNLSASINYAELTGEGHGGHGEEALPDEEESSKEEPVEEQKQKKKRGRPPGS